MFTKSISATICAYLGIIIALATYYSSDVDLEAFSIAPIAAFVMPLLVIYTNRAYQLAKLPISTSVLQLLFFASYLACGLGLILGFGTSFLVFALGTAFVALVGLMLRALKPQGVTYKGLLLGISAVFALSWMPIVVLSLNHGWVATPSASIILLPLAIMLINISYQRTRENLPAAIIWSEIAFLFLWFLIGAFLINHNDTIAQSIATQIAGNAISSDTSTRIYLLLLPLVAICLFYIALNTFMRRSTNTKTSNTTVPSEVRSVPSLGAASGVFFASSALVGGYIAMTNFYTHSAALSASITVLLTTLFAAFINVYMLVKSKYRNAVPFGTILSGFQGLTFVVGCIVLQPKSGNAEASSELFLFIIRMAIVTILSIPMLKLLYMPESIRNKKIEALLLTIGVLMIIIAAGLSFYFY